MQTKPSNIAFCLGIYLFSFAVTPVAFGQNPALQPAETLEESRESEQVEASEKFGQLRQAVMLDSGGRDANDRDPDQNLLNANFQHITDSKGFRWDIQTSYGGINDGTNDCFDGGLFLFVNNNQFRANSRMMTADGQEYVFMNTMGTLHVTRRMLINRELGAARFLEIFKNQTDQPRKVSVQIRTNLGSNPQVILSSDGKQTTGAISKEQVGIYSVSPGGGRPSVAFLLADVHEKQNRPELQFINDNIIASWELEIPANDTLAILHGVAQRNGGNATLVFKELYDRGYLHAQLPEALQKKIVNFKVRKHLSGTPLVDRVSLLAEQFDLERGKDDQVWIDEETIIAGRVEADELTIQSGFGKTQVPWEEVAAVVGGADVDARMQLLLRNGEVLHGLISANGLKLSSPDGIDAAIELDKLKFLLARVSPRDNFIPADAELMLTTSSGQRLLTTNADEASLGAATPWGELDVPLDQVAHLQPDDGAETSRRILLRDGSRLTLIAQPKPFEIKTSRFGAVSLLAGRVQEVCQLIQMKEGDGSSDEEYVPIVPETPAPPFVTLVGENMLPGRLAFESLEIYHDNGHEQIKASDVKGLKLVMKDTIRPLFEVELRTGKVLEGYLNLTQFRLKGLSREWVLPANHLQAYEAGEQSPEAEARLETDPTQ
ncbi:MAG: hypothetical protein AAGB26_07510 [Planctomycetota bacterium]